MGEGGDFFIKLQCFLEIMFCHSLNHGFGIQLQRAGGIAVGRLFMDAEALLVLQLFLGEHPLLPVYMGGFPFFQKHKVSSS